MSKVYLYAAAVQGIQNFIFKTNKLKHIIGASELVEQICTEEFNEFKRDGEIVISAAGNIKCVFSKLEDCKNAYRNFPKKIMTKAPGITVSQAIAEYDDSDNSGFGKAIDDVERLLKVQRNKPPKSVLSGLMGIKRVNDTGLPVTTLSKDRAFFVDDATPSDKKVFFVDDATKAKLDAYNLMVLCKKSFKLNNLKSERLAYNISNIKGKNDWIAIIHADGNGLGKVVQKVGKDKGLFREFSESLNEATIHAANAAYEAVKGKFSENDKIPIRPVVLGGDDMTVIIRGNLAIEYTKEFIHTFEKETKNLLGNILTKKEIFADGKDYLTACAGIAFIKSSYPFYYGYQLAEELCGQAKKDTKAMVGKDDLPASCLMFHKVQDSFITNYEAIVERELTVPADKSSKTAYSLFKAGPYYIKEQKNRYTVDDLEKNSSRLDGESGNGVKSGIRNWITLRLEGEGRAEQLKRRMEQIFKDDKNDKNTIDQLTKMENEGRCIAYDVLAYHTIMNQETNSK